MNCQNGVKTAFCSHSLAVVLFVPYTTQENLKTHVLMYSIVVEFIATIFIDFTAISLKIDFTKEDERNGQVRNFFVSRDFGKSY